jgi:TRAP-type C4-dicarboxylate transport system substrate-binding protein
MTQLTRRAALAAGGALLALPAIRQAAQAATTWSAYTYMPVASVAAARALIRIIDGVKEKTNGDLVINLHLGGSLPINATNITPAVADGIVQLADDGFTTGNVPISAVLRLPLLLQSQDELAKAMEILRPHLEKAYTKKGVVLLNQYSYPFQVLWSRKKLESLDDIKGQKLRVTSVEQGEFIRRFGGVPLTMGTPDVAAALDRGVVDGCLTASSGGGVTWHDLVKYRYAFPTSYVNSNVVANKDAFEKLPAAQQAILRDAAAEAATWVIAEMQRQEDDYTAQFAKDGLILADATPEDIRRATGAMQPYWAEWAKKHGPEAVEVLGRIRTVVGR